MEHRQLGRTGVSVSKLCLGTMMFGDWGNKDHEDSIRIIHRALDAGINFIDTADIYSQGESEIILGKALAGGRRDDIVLATKAWGPMGEDPNQRGVSRRWIIREVEGSLKRLGTDWIDLYQIHRYEPGVDIEETLGALTDLVHQGKVRYVGSSMFPPSAIVEAQWIARERNLQHYVCGAAAVLDARPRDRGRRAAHLPALRNGSDPVEPALRRLAGRALAQGRR
jgi:aryl-alcohol dehydrogenase-like predicted oxidoreductase